MEMHIPAAVLEARHLPDTTTLVLPRQNAEVDARGNILLRSRPAGGLTERAPS